jgi:hypothetical protein
MEIDLSPVVSRTLKFLQHSPRGASRIDILTAMNLQTSAWIGLRQSLEQSGEIVITGRGPGLRIMHRSLFDESALPEPPSYRKTSLERMEAARGSLRNVLQEKGIIDSLDAQEATGFKADPVRRLLLQMVSEGQVERSGHKRSTRYRWVG